MARLADLAPDGPDEMGRELAEGPAAVEGTLAAVERAAPEIAALIEETRRTVLVGTGASLAVARAAAPAWRESERGRGGQRAVVIRESAAAVLGDADGEIFLPGDLVVAISQSGTSPETVAAAGRAARIGCRVIAVSAAADSALCGVARLSVVTPSGHEGGAATKSALSALAVLLAIAGAVAADAASRASAGRRLRDVVADWPAAAALGPLLAGAERLWIVGLGSAAGLTAAARPSVAREGPPARRGDHGLGIPARAGGGGAPWGCGSAPRCGSGRSGAVAVPRPPAGRARPARRATRDGGARRARGAARHPLGLAPGGLAELEALLRIQQLARATAHAAGTYQDGFRVLRAIVRRRPSLRLRAAAGGTLAGACGRSPTPS